MKRVAHPLDAGGDSVAVLAALRRLGAGSFTAKEIAGEAELDHALVVRVLAQLANSKRVDCRGSRYRSAPDQLDGWDLWGGQGRLEL